MRLADGSRIAVLALAALLAACSTRYTSLGNGDGGRQIIYELSEEEALGLANAAIVSSFPGRRVIPVMGASKGYKTYTRVLLDTHTQQVLVHPVIGVAADGRSVEGYHFEVTGFGSTVSGMVRNGDFFDALLASLAKTGKGVMVASLRPRPYVEPTAPVEPPETFAVAPADPDSLPLPLEAAPGGDPISQIERLKALLDKGAITAAEYERKKAELLKRL
jgi:hypothetical protein